MGLPGLDAEEDPDSPCLINTVEICAVGCRSPAEGHLKGGVALGCFWQAMGADVPSTALRGNAGG